MSEHANDTQLTDVIETDTIALSEANSTARYSRGLNQLQSAIKVGLGKLCICTRDPNLRFLRSSLLSLDRAINDGQHLALTHPIARFDTDR